MRVTQVDPGLAAAENYESLVVVHTTGPFAGILLEYAAPLTGEKVVDVACGTGIVARLAAPRVGNTGAVVGVDLNPHMIAYGQSLPTSAGATIEWREGNATDLPLPDDSFDLVLCQAGLQFVPDRITALREMYRVLRPGGRVALSVWRSIEHQPASQIIWSTIARYLNTTVDVINRAYSLGDADELHDLLEEAGFIEVAIVPHSYTVRQPLNPLRISQIYTSLAGVLPFIADMDEEQRTALAQMVEAEIEPAFQQYIDGDQELYPLSTHIALAYKP